MAAVLDRKTGYGSSSGNYTGFSADVASITDYYPFGMPIAERSVVADSLSPFRMGFNNKEKDNEVYGKGNFQDYGMRGYDPRIIRLNWSVDPLTKSYPWLTPYQFASNTPIQAIDLDGGEAMKWFWSFWSMLGNNKPMEVHSNNVEDEARHQTDMANRRKATENVKKDVKKLYDAQKFAFSFIPGMSSAYSLREGNYGESSTYFALDLFGASSIRGMFKYIAPSGELLIQGSGKIGGTACIDFAANFVKKFGKYLEGTGAVVKRFEINIGRNGLIGTADQQLSNTGLHQFIEVTKDGKSLIYDNFFNNAKGITKREYMEKLGGQIYKGKYISGEELVNKAKEIK